MLLLQKQDEAIEFTDTAIMNSNTQSYIVNPIYERNFTSTLERQHLLKLQKSVNYDNAINSLVQKTDERITKAFDEFKDKQTAGAIISREFNHTLTYFDTLNIIRKIRYTDMDNLMPIVTAINAVIYEAMQLTVVLQRAQRFLNTYDKNFKKYFKPYYVMMDGVNSKKHLKQQGEAYVNEIINATDILNSYIKNKSEKLDLICDFVAYKQDEIHGVINGDINKFLDIAKQVYENTELRVVYSQGDKDNTIEPIENIEQSVIGTPFELYGSACYDCREKMNYPDQQIFLKHGKIYTYEQLQKMQGGREA